jgi:hypothetical protein
MRGWKSALVVSVAAALGWAGPTAGKSPPPKAESSCGEYGTAVHFEDTPADAARAARKAEKLVLVLHVSGHFENPEFT